MVGWGEWSIDIMRTASAQVSLAMVGLGEVTDRSFMRTALAEGGADAMEDDFRIEEKRR